MAKTTAPLFGFAAEGSVGESITFSQWRGIRYAKRYTKPSNPNTTEQQLTRGVFAMLNQFWKLAPAGMVNAWTAFAKGRSFVNRNAFIGQNTRLLRQDPPATSMIDMIASPGVGGAAPPSSISAAVGDTQTIITVGLPSVPTGWTLAASAGIAFVDQAPDDPFTSQVHYASDAVSPEDLTITGLTNGETYVVAVWLQFTKPDGSTAYSISLTDTVIPSA